MKKLIILLTLLPILTFAQTFKFERLSYFSEGLAAARVGGDWGYINKKGKFVIKPHSSNRDYPFLDSRALIYVNGKYGYINKKGELVIKAVYNKAYSFYKGKALVLFEKEKSEKLKKMIDEYFKLIASEEKTKNKREFYNLSKKEDKLLQDISELRKKEKIEKQWHLINVNGEKVQEFKKPSDYKFFNKIRNLSYDFRFDKNIELRRRPVEVLKIRLKEEEKEELKLPLKKKGVHLIFDGTFWTIFDYEYGDYSDPFDQIGFFNEGLAWVCKGVKERYGYVNEFGKIIIPIKFEYARAFYERRAIVGMGGKIDEEAYSSTSGQYIGGKYGVIDRKGHWIVKPIYEQIGNFLEGLAIVKLNGRYAFIDRHGKVVIGLVK